MKRVLAFVAAFVLGLVCGYLLGAWPARDRGVVVRESQTVPWIEIWEAGELLSEWQPSDGRIYECLKAVLREGAPDVVRRSPGPTEGPRQ